MEYSPLPHCLAFKTFYGTIAIYNKCITDLMISLLHYMYPGCLSVSSLNQVENTFNRSGKLYRSYRVNYEP